MSTYENRDVEEKRANKDEDAPIVRLEKVAVDEDHVRDLRISNQCKMMRIDLHGESPVNDRPRFDGFDSPIPVPQSGRRLLRHLEYRNNKLALVKVYAQLGLHRYNLLEGTNWEFLRLESYNKGMNTGAAPYYLTLFATSPSGEMKPFHALVCEERIGCFDISVPVARLKGSKEQPRRSSHIYRPMPLPRWPSSEMISQHFYMLNEHELRNTVWVRLYLDLVHCTCDRSMSESQLSGFEIVQVAIQSLSDVEPPRLNSTNAVVYIVYKDLAKATYRNAIIRRIYIKPSRSFSLQGVHWCPSEKKEKKRCTQPGVMASAL